MTIKKMGFLGLVALFLIPVSLLVRAAEEHPASKRATSSSDEERERNLRNSRGSFEGAQRYFGVAGHERDANARQEMQAWLLEARAELSAELEAREQDDELPAGDEVAVGDEPRQLLTPRLVTPPSPLSLSGDDASGEKSSEEGDSPREPEAESGSGGEEGFGLKKLKLACPSEPWRSREAETGYAPDNDEPAVPRPPKIRKQKKVLAQSWLYTEPFSEPTNDHKRIMKGVMQSLLAKSYSNPT